MIKFNLPWILLGVMSSFLLADKKPSEPMMFPDTGCWGVVYQTGNPKTYAEDIPLLKDLGVRWVRLCVYWGGSEYKTRGTYDWTYSDAILNPYKDSGLKVICILCLETICPLYEKEKADKEVVLAAIEKWMGTFADRYKGRGIVYELTNEPLHGYGMGGYWTDPKVYSRMCRMTAAAIKKADPTAKTAAYSETISAGSEYLKQMFQAGIVDDGTIDMIAVHPYSRPTVMPETDLDKDITWLRQTITQYNKSKTPVIVADTEKGYAMRDFLTPKDSWPNRVYSRTEQAAYLARHYLTQIGLGVEIAVWYKAIKGEEGFSLFVERAGTLTPMGYAYKNLARLLPENPKKLFNDKYPVSVSGGKKLIVKSYLKKGKNGNALVIAVWNPVEAFDGKILESRKEVGDKAYEAWRAISPEDKVEISAQVKIGNLSRDKVKKVFLYHLAATEEKNLQTPVNVKVNFAGNAGTTETIKVGPMPTIMVLEGDEF
jgi:hypothetical protein